MCTYVKLVVPSEDEKGMPGVTWVSWRGGARVSSWHVLVYTGLFVFMEFLFCIRKENISGERKV